MTPDVDLALITKADVPASALLSGLHIRCFDEPWTIQAVADILAMPGAFALVAEVEDEGAAVAAGFAIARQAADEVELLSLGVLLPYRRRQLGGRLIDAVAAQARAGGARFLFLEVAEDNHAAQALYRSRGFVRIGRRAGYYRRFPGPAAAALTFRLRLGSPIDPWPLL